MDDAMKLLANWLTDCNLTIRSLDGFQVTVDGTVHVSIIDVDDVVILKPYVPQGWAFI